MKDGIPIIYWTFRSAWTALHFLLVLATAVLLLWWAIKGGNADRFFHAAGTDLLDFQRRVAGAVPWPWGG